MSGKISDLSYRFTGPVLFHYTCWVLHEAQKRQIRTLYFLARDGYLLYQIALKICEAQNLDIECRYLYGSRTALRLPSYHLIGEEAFDLLLLGSYRPSRRSILERIDLDLKERELIYRDLGYETDMEVQTLNYEDFYYFADQLRNCETYRKKVFDKSKEAYPNTIGYLKQEKLLEQSHIGIVDSGWSGTIQRSLRQLLTSAGYHGKITGFYFGIFRFLKREEEDGEFCSWYFGEGDSTLNKLLFSNNLFECFLSAPHGMTIGFDVENGVYKPVLKGKTSERMRILVDAQIEAVLHYTDNCLKTFDWNMFDGNHAKKQTQHILRRLMAKPTREEADIWGQFVFDDDITGNGEAILSNAEQIQQLHDNYLLIPRIYRKLTGKSKQHVNQDLFWPYATAAYLKNPVVVGWYRVNIFLWDLLRHGLKH